MKIEFSMVSPWEPNADPYTVKCLFLSLSVQSYTVYVKNSDSSFLALLEKCTRELHLESWYLSFHLGFGSFFSGNEFLC